jgi:hypothetical protein
VEIFSGLIILILIFIIGFLVGFLLRAQMLAKELKAMKAGMYVSVKYREDNWQQWIICARVDDSRLVTLDPDGDISDEGFDGLEKEADIESFKLGGPREGVPSGVARAECYPVGDKLDDDEKEYALKNGQAKLAIRSKESKRPRGAMVDTGSVVHAADVGPDSGPFVVAAPDLPGSRKAVSADSDGGACHSLFLFKDCPHLGQHFVYLDSAGKARICIFLDDEPAPQELRRWCITGPHILEGGVSATGTAASGALPEDKVTPRAGDKSDDKLGGFNAGKNAMHEPIVDDVKGDVPHALGDSAHDAWTLPLNFEAEEAGSRGYRDSISMLSLTDGKQFPVTGPRTEKWLCTFFETNNITPSQWHKIWRHILKVQVTDIGASEHESFHRGLECLFGAQLKVSELGGIEILARHRHLHEKRYRLKLIVAERGAGKTGIDYDDAIIVIGGSRDNGSAAICPALLDHVAELAKQEAAILKERRKAHKERELSRKSNKS